MRIIKNKRDKNIAKLEIEIAHDELEKAFEGAYKKLNKNARIPGFRKGKAPRMIFESHYGTQGIVQEGVIDAVNDAYRQGVTEIDLEIIDSPKNLDVDEYKENQPLVFKCEVDVKPEVKLGKYKGIKVEKKSDDLQEEKVDEEIKRYLESHAEYQESNEPVGEDSVVRCDIKATMNGEAVENLTRSNAGVKVGMKTYGEDFDTEITGLKKEASKSFSVTLPDDEKFTTYKGQVVDFEVLILDIKEKQLPELTDDLVKEKFKEHDSAEAFKTAIREQLQTQLKQENLNHLQEQLIKSAVEAAKLEVQPVLIEREIDRSIQEFEHNLRRSGMDYKNYLQMSGTSEEKVRENFKEGAEARVKSELVLEAIGESEKIDVNDEDVQIEIKGWNLPQVQSDDEINNYLNSINTESLKTMIKSKKTLAFLEENAKIKHV